MEIPQIQLAAEAIKNGGVIAYPTEAVYGLGCEPFNESAVRQLLKLKGRPIYKGLIIIGSSWEQLSVFTQPVASQVLGKALATWPGPVTWLFPAAISTPLFLRGEHSTIALRVTAHPIAKALCEVLGAPIVSTSANLADHPPARTFTEVLAYWPTGLQYVLAGEVGTLGKPTSIRDLLTGQIIR